MTVASLQVRCMSDCCACQTPGKITALGGCSSIKHQCLSLPLCAGDDSTLLSIAAAVEAALPAIPPPPETPACQGCSPTATPITVEFPAEALATPSSGPVNVTMYILDMKGSCPLQAANDFPIFPPTF